VCWRLLAAMRELREAVATFERTATAGAEDLAAAARDAGRQVDRLDDLIRTTGHITDTVDTATQATFRALSSPVIKTAAIASGTSRAAKRLRRGTGS
jgi:endonuclease III